MKTKPWTSEDDKLLMQEVLAGTRTDLIASRVGRSKSAVKHRVSILGLGA